MWVCLDVLVPPDIAFGRSRFAFSRCVVLCARGSRLFRGGRAQNSGVLWRYVMCFWVF